MTRMPHIKLAPPLCAAVILLAILSMSPVTLTFARQDASLAPIEVGSGPIRERALGLTGRNVYGPDSVEMFGYLTSVIGLDPSLLFTDGTPSERTARFTYASISSVASRADRGDVTTFDGEGDLRIFLDDAGASWDDPGTFADGQPLAEFSIQLRDTLHRQAPGVGVLVGDGQLSQVTAAEFSMDGEQYRFGNAGIEQRLHYVGALLNGVSEPPSFVVELTGMASVAARESIPVNVGQPPTTAATPLAEACPELQPWLDQTTAALNQAQTFASVIGANEDAAALDVAAVRQAASDMASLVETQRGVAVPEEATAANRLIVTGLSTYVRGLGVITTAAAEQDAELLAQGQAVVADGSLLLERAQSEVAALVDTCSSLEKRASQAA